MLLKFFSEEGDFERVGLAEDGVLGVAIDGREAHGDVETVGGGHGLGHGVEVHGGVAALAGGVDDGDGELAAETGSVVSGTNPEALHLAGALVWVCRMVEVEGLEGYAAGGGLVVVEGEEDGSGGFGVGAGEGGEFFFERLDADVLAADGFVEEVGVLAHEDSAEVEVGGELRGAEGRHRDRVQGLRVTGDRLRVAARGAGLRGEGVQPDIKRA